MKVFIVKTIRIIEHIVIDGASTDGTIEILKPYQEQGLLRYHSEADQRRIGIFRGSF